MRDELIEKVAKEFHDFIEEIRETGKIPTEEKCKEIYENVLYLKNRMEFIHKRMMELPPYRKVVEEIEQTKNSKKCQ